MFYARHDRPAADAKAAVQRVPGVRAVAFQQARGRKYLIISAVHNGHRGTRDVPVSPTGTVADGQIVHALRVLVGRSAAEGYAP